MQISFNLCDLLQQLQIYIYAEDQKTTATNADLLLIMRNQKKTTAATELQIYFYLCETLKTKKQHATTQIYI